MIIAQDGEFIAEISGRNSTAILVWAWPCRPDMSKNLATCHGNLCKTNPIKSNIRYIVYKCKECGGPKIINDLLLVHCLSWKINIKNFLEKQNTQGVVASPPNGINNLDNPIGTIQYFFQDLLNLHVSVRSLNLKFFRSLRPQTTSLGNSNKLFEFSLLKYFLAKLLWHHYYNLQSWLQGYEYCKQKMYNILENFMNWKHKRSFAIFETYQNVIRSCGEDRVTVGWKFY